MSDVLGTVRRLARQVLLTIGRGRVTVTDDAGPVQMMQVRMNHQETIDRLPRLAEFGFTSRPPAGSDVVVVFIDGDRSNGAVIASNHQSTRLKGLALGDSALFDARGRYIWLGKDGGVVIEAAGSPVVVNGATTVTINAADKVRMVTPMLECTGEIKDLCDSPAGTTMSKIREEYNMHTHPVPNVQAGGSTATSDPPSESL